LKKNNAVRTGVGLNDLSGMGEIETKGTDALSLVQKVIVNDVNRISDNQSLYTPICNDRGMNYVQS